MSDLNQIPKDIIEQNQEEISLINDNFKNILISDENDSEYEDVEEDEIIDTSILTSITNKSSLKAALDDDELLINIQPRRTTHKKIQDDEHSEGDENVPKTRGDLKQTSKIKDTLDDDNNTQSPAYIPRKGKFYEHDDRTLDENDRSKQEISRNENRIYKDSDAIWQHDLYFRDEQISKFRHPIPKRNQSIEIHSKTRYNHHREQLHLNDYMVRSQKDHITHHQQQYQNDYRRRLPQELEKKPRTNNFDFKDSLSYNRNGLNRDRNIQTAPRGEYNPYQIDERTFHRRRNFTNNQFQQQENASKFNKNSLNRIDQRQSKENYQFQGNNDYHQYEGLRKYELYENKNNLPPRLRGNNNNYRNSTQKQEYQEKLISNSSTNIDRPKRYSNMRNNMTNSIQPQSSSQIKPYQDQHSNQFDQNDWPQAPPPPTSYPLQQQYYQQSISRYVPINYSQGSIFEQFQANK